MKAQRYILASLLLFVCILGGCQKDDDNSNPELKITLEDVTDITETSFVINWTLSHSAIKSISIDVASNSSFSADVKTIVVANTASTSQKVDNLHGATTYYFRMLVTLDDGSTKTSYNKTAITSYASEAVEFYTSDGVRISGVISYLTGDRSKKPGIILLDGYTQSKTWVNTDIFLRFLASGNVCCVFDYRGHGNSGDWELPWTDDMPEVIKFVSIYALNDLIACHEYFSAHELVDSTRLALIGSSLGATESLNGNYLPGIKASVALSAFHVGLNTGQTHKGCFFIACEEDEQWYGNCSDLAESIYAAAAEPKKLLILPGESHGYQIIVRDNTGEVEQVVIDWVNDRMNDR